MNLSPSDWHWRFTQQARWTQHIRRYLYEQAGLADGARLLEVGCGTGAILAELSRQPGLQVHGLDLERAYLALAGRHAPGAHLLQGDAHHIPYAGHSFDLVVCHFLLLWVADPLGVVSEMARLARPDGAVLALAEPDYGGRIDYPEPLAQLGAWQEDALRRQGAETRLGRRLRAIFQRAGLQQVETGVLGGQWRQATLPEDWDSEWQVLTADLQDRVPAGELARLRDLDARAHQHGERLLYVPTFYAWGKVTA